MTAAAFKQAFDSAEVLYSEPPLPLRRESGDSEPYPVEALGPIVGPVPDAAGDPAGDGLAVWLAGRKLLAITADYAVAKAVAGGRSYFNRRSADGAVLLWDLGKPKNGRDIECR